MHGKRGRERVERIPAAPTARNEARGKGTADSTPGKQVIVAKDGKASRGFDIESSYVTVNCREVPSLRYFTIRIGEHALTANRFRL